MPLPPADRQPFDAVPSIGYDAHNKLARRCYQHPGPWRHLLVTGDAVVLYYLQTRSRQEAGLFYFARA